jgi:hypothetical protein
MSDIGEALEMMRAVAKSRIEMLEKGITFHDKVRRNYYLHEYREKLGKIEEIIRRMNIRLVVANNGTRDRNPSPLNQDEPS